VFCHLYRTFSALVLISYYEASYQFMTTNPYLAFVRSNLPRLLSLFDQDPTSHSFGMGDRFFWGWGLIDFGNATYQGAAHGMARLWKSKQWPYPTQEKQFVNRIDSLFAGTSALLRMDGSLEEAFPNEGSYCVTALVAFDLLSALNLLQEDIDDSTHLRWRCVISPMIDFLIEADETHAVISNHLATAVAALVKWHDLTGDQNAEIRGRQLLDRILSHQSEEGWFMEYAGADPGYQSLCTYYLADVHIMRPDWNLYRPLSQSIKFLHHFAHPDGSFGGLYGSRCTRFYYPAGIVALSKEMPEAAELACFMLESIKKQCVVTLSSMDEPNLVPMFNAYCWAAELFGAGKTDVIFSTPSLPAVSSTCFRHHFPQAGLIVDRGLNHYSIISTNKGGVVYHFVGGKAVIVNAGVVVKNSKVVNTFNYRIPSRQ